jgi:predicted nuclease of predicted toxin-antitoxin system
MKIWVDAQLSPQIAVWINSEFAVDAVPIRDIGLRDAEDEQIFMAAARADAIVLTKDRDFVLLLDRFGPPPQIIWLTCGNTSNEALKKILFETLPETLELLRTGEQIVEIGSI